MTPSLLAARPATPTPAPIALDQETRTFLQQILQEMHHASPPTWKRHWQARYGLPPHSQFVRFVKHQALTLSPAELLPHLEREHHLEVRAHATLRQDFRHAQPDRYRVLLREVREGLRTLAPRPARRRDRNRLLKPTPGR